MKPPYEVHGNGHPVLFLGGMLQPHETFGRFVNLAVTEGLQIIRIGYRGHHFNGGVDFSLDDIIDDAIHVLDELGIEKVDVIGEALGGTLVLGLAKRYPNRVNKLCVNGVVSKRDVERIAQFKYWFEILKNEGLEALVDAIMPDMFHEEWAKKNQEKVLYVKKQLVEGRTQEGLIQLFQSAARYRFTTSDFAIIEAPVLIIAARFDTIVSREHAYNLQSLISNAKLVEFESGHAISKECPEQMLKTFKEFVG